MIQALGIFGFFLSLLAIFIAGETMRRTTERQLKSEMELFKANLRIQDLEQRVLKLDRFANSMHQQKKRQAGTLTAMAEKGEPEKIRETRLGDAKGRFTPSEHVHQKSG